MISISIKRLFFLKWVCCFFVVINLTSCNDLILNSNTFDESRFNTTYDGGSNFQRIMPTIVSKCASCHEHSEWLSFSELDFVDAGYVVNGSPSLSSMYYRLSNALVGPGPRNMPQGGGSDFTDEEVTELENWINGVGF